MDAFLAAFLPAVIVSATPLIYAAIGELVTERAGVLNLGVEGMMLIGAIAAFGVSLSTGSSLMGIMAGAAAGAAAAGLFAVVALGFSANQVATGLALTIFGTGMSGLIGKDFVGQKLEPLADLIPAEALPDIPALRAIFAQDPMVFGAFGLVIAVWIYLSATRSGLKLKAIGDDASSAHALGLKVGRSRLAAVLFGGLCSGLGGAYLSLAYTPFWGEDMTAGRGWIALALVVFASWIPWRVILGALIFAAATQGQFWGGTLQGLTGVSIPSQFLAMTPYLATILALVLISMARRGSGAPAMLGKPFRAGR